MKRISLLVLGALALLGTPALGLELDTKQGASLSVKTLTELGIDLDDPSRYGLAFSVPELALTFDLFGYQKVSNRLKSPDPVGFLDLTLGEVQVRFANSSVPDYNNPGQTMKFGFNDSAAGKTGYFGPLYLQNVRSGILWGDWIIQLGAGGTDSFWDPWHREASGYGQMATSWAYLDTRVQYQRPLVPAVIKNPNSETNYWSYDGLSGSLSTGVDELGFHFEGPLVGLQYAGTEFSAMAKAGTTNTWTSAAPNGLLFGLDASYAPTGFKGLRWLGSTVLALNQGSAQVNTSQGGMKVGYDLALPKSGLKISSVEPYVGLDLAREWGSAGKTSAEAAVGLTLHWPGMNGWGDDFLQGPDGRTGNVYSGATLALKSYAPDVALAQTLKHSAQLTWYNDPDGGLVNSVGSEFVAQWKDFTNAGNSVLMVTGYVDTSLPGVWGGTLVPWTKVYFDNAKLASHPDRITNAMVYGGLKLKRAIRNAEFALTYQSRNLTGNKNSTDLDLGYGALGVLKASVTISL